MDIKLNYMKIKRKSILDIFKETIVIDISYLNNNEI